MIWGRYDNSLRHQIQRSRFCIALTNLLLIPISYWYALGDLDNTILTFCTFWKDTQAPYQHFKYQFWVSCFLTFPFLGNVWTSFYVVWFDILYNQLVGRFSSYYHKYLYIYVTYVDLMITLWHIIMETRVYWCCIRLKCRVYTSPCAYRTQFLLYIRGPANRVDRCERFVGIWVCDIDHALFLKLDFTYLSVNVVYWINHWVLVEYILHITCFTKYLIILNTRGISPFVLVIWI